MLFKTVFRLAYRQSRGFAQRMLKLMNLKHLEVPSLTHGNRRFRALGILPFGILGLGLITITIDSTGVKIYGEDEWKFHKYGWSKHRTWKRLYLGVDPEIGFIYYNTTATNLENDESQVDNLLDQMDAEIDELYLDDTYDAQTCYDGLLERDVILPLHRKETREGSTWRNWAMLMTIPGINSSSVLVKLSERSGEGISCHRRCLSKTAMFRYKAIFGSQHYSESLETQTQENKIKIKALSHITVHTMPIYQPISCVIKRNSSVIFIRDLHATTPITTPKFIL
jgi:hypothetical protein